VRRLFSGGFFVYAEPGEKSVTYSTKKPPLSETAFQKFTCPD